MIFLKFDLADDTQFIWFMIALVLVWLIVMVYFIIRNRLKKNFHQEQIMKRWLESKSAMQTDDSFHESEMPFVSDMHAN
jgi:threonine/homoserine/homoserine lactone efflux protein